MAQQDSPSLARRCASVNICACGDDIECLLASVVVGNFFSKSVMLLYRVLSTRFRSAVDARVREWCVRFRSIQDEWLSLGGRSALGPHCERAVQLLVKMESLAVRAFGKRNTVLLLPLLSKVDVATYHATLQRKCVLCGFPLGRLEISGHERYADAPVFTMAHVACERKHCVFVASRHALSARPTPAAELAREVASVANHKKIALFQENVEPLLCTWHERGKRLEGEGRWLWVRPHEHVREEHTLYGALGVTRADVEDALAAEERQRQQHRDNAEARRRAVEARALEAAVAMEAEVRVFLGRRKTRWRCIRDLDDFHPGLAGELGLFVSRSERRGVVHSAAWTNIVLRLLHESTALMKRPLKSCLKNWIVDSLQVAKLFGPTAHELMYVDATQFEEAVHQEAVLHAQIFDFVDSMDEHNLLSVKTRVVNMFSGEHCFAITPCSKIGNFCARPQVLLTHTEILKLKFAILENTNNSLSVLPSLPTPDADVAFFIKTLLSTALERESGARELALHFLVPLHIVRELKTTLCFEDARFALEDA